MRLRRTILWSVAGIATSILAARLAFASAAVGEAAPALVVQELNGQKFDLSKQGGKVVVVNFWATWCPPCREEMPALDAVYRRYRAHGLEMVGLSADRPHDRDEAIKVGQSFSYPDAILATAQSNDFGSPSSLPLTFVIDRTGIVRFEFTPDKSPVTEASLSAAVSPLLAEHQQTKP
jgi:peroxiredoxin